MAMMRGFGDGLEILKSRLVADTNTGPDIDDAVGGFNIISDGDCAAHIPGRI